MIRLWELKASAFSIIKKIDHDIPPLFQKRLTDLGIVAGENITCLQRPPFGAPRTYMVGSCVLSLDEEIASHVHIEEKV